VRRVDLGWVVSLIYMERVGVYEKRFFNPGDHMRKEVRMLKRVDFPRRVESGYESGQPGQLFFFM